MGGVPLVGRPAVITPGAPDPAQRVHRGVERATVATDESPPLVAGLVETHEGGTDRLTYARSPSPVAGASRVIES